MVLGLPQQRPLQSVPVDPDRQPWIYLVWLIPWSGMWPTINGYAAGIGYIKYCFRCPESQRKRYFWWKFLSQENQFQGDTALSDNFYYGIKLYFNQVQRRLQLRIETQGKYLQSILEKACKALNEHFVAYAGAEVEAVGGDLSGLANRVPNNCSGNSHLSSSTKTVALTEMANSIEGKSLFTGDCCLESSIGNQFSMAGLGSGTSIMKKRPFETNMQKQVEWMMNNIWISLMGWISVS